MVSGVWRCGVAARFDVQFAAQGADDSPAADLAARFGLAGSIGGQSSFPRPAGWHAPHTDCLSRPDGAGLVMGCRHGALLFHQP
ncbi:hypothetical protein [Photorhabdus luminescens]|uniref:hypothetical protein n=1 Tax=Photorhabdus luminescens TaxID=29488 RepID=UPI0020CEF177|nr:hypothetical protein [Photorhabdus luminescens]